jgi:predicted nuclease with TOPRIM domain
MTGVLLVCILIGAVLALVTGVRALRSWLRYRRARIELRDHLTEEVANLLSRTGEMEENLSNLEARSQQLPIQLAELQESLTTLRILTSALTTSLAQLQRVLSFSALKTLSALHLSNPLPSRSDTGKPG